jgi:hypothetical protein
MNSNVDPTVLHHLASSEARDKLQLLEQRLTGVTPATTPQQHASFVPGALSGQAPAMQGASLMQLDAPAGKRQIDGSSDQQPGSDSGNHSSGAGDRSSADMQPASKRRKQNKPVKHHPPEEPLKSVTNTHRRGGTPQPGTPGIVSPAAGAPAAVSSLQQQQQQQQEYAAHSPLPGGLGAAMPGTTPPAAGAEAGGSGGTAPGSSSRAARHRGSPGGPLEGGSNPPMSPLRAGEGSHL